MGARILIVEDEGIVQLDLQSRLQRLGHSVVGASASGEEAIRKAVETKPDLVLMDITLAGSMDGIEAAAAIREIQPIPILFLTANSALLEEHSIVTEPVLTKPFRTDELQAAIDKVLKA